MRLISAERFVVRATVVAAAAAAGIAVALLVTPMQTVQAAGQTVRVGAAAPTLTLSGPGELDLFGQRLPTTVQFAGPVRPRLELTRITLSQQLAELVSGGRPAAKSAAAKALQDALVEGWTRYLMWQVVIAGGVALVLLGAIAGWRRSSPRTAIALVAVGVVATEIVNLGAIMVTAYTAPDRLRQVTSLQALVGGAPAPTLPTAPHPARHVAGRVAVIGDSTAAGLGNPLVAGAGDADRVCHRSADSFASVLNAATSWRVTNYACSGATIRHGLLGAQHAGSQTIPPQLPAAVDGAPSAIVISIGANDVNWSALLRACAASKHCRDAALDAYFQQQLATFTQDYYVLVAALRTIPEPPAIIVNLYYNPLGDNLNCVASKGITAAKRAWLTDSIDALNTVLAEGARAAGFSVARPNFSGHGLCSSRPYVQGLDAAAPFHPTAAGALAIALADQQALGGGPRG
ncbi:SGNH/GDSL hydrolase family protein [Mycolicibacterium moriokaense]|nr:SGNH/GDSL hydrolase family protein [Mycolicibacterium moriokaense]